MQREEVEAGSRTKRRGSWRPGDEVATVAAIDLGSNSFHMLVARDVDGHLQTLDKVRERVQLAAGLHEGTLDRDTEDRALACLRRLGQRVKDLPADHVRAVGTNTFRQLHDDGFFERATGALGHPIEVVSGREEARLIYLGAAHDLAGDSARRLVVDIGGGSTECIIGEQLEPLECDSLYMGCVTYSRAYFDGGRITADRFERAALAARLELQSIERRYTERGWMDTVGTSGTINAIDAIVRAKGWSTEGITRQGLQRLRDAMIAAKRTDKLDFPTLDADRAPVLPGGVAILSAVFDSLGIDRLTFSQGALREGLAYDLLGRIHHEDIRDRTVERLMDRYLVDEDQAHRVERTALELHAQVARTWAIDGEEPRHMLAWGARLHEIGIAVSYSGYHKHGAYLIANSDLPGFSRDERELLAALVHNHRRKVRRTHFAHMPRERARLAERLCVLLRLAVVLNRSRSPQSIGPVTLAVHDSSLTLGFPAGWLEAHPLTAADLELEEEALHKGLGLALRFASR